MYLDNAESRKLLRFTDARLVQGSWSPSWPKIAISHCLEVSPLQQCTH